MRDLRQLSGGGRFWIEEKTEIFAVGRRRLPGTAKYFVLNGATEATVGVDATTG